MKKVIILIIILALAAMVVASFNDISPFSDWKLSIQDWVNGNSAKTNEQTAANFPHGIYTTQALKYTFQLNFIGNTLKVSSDLEGSFTYNCVVLAGQPTNASPLTIIATNVTKPTDKLTILYYSQYDIVKNENTNMEYSK